MKVNEPPVIVSQTFELPLKTVWKAITNVYKMRQWYFDNIPAFEATVGFKTEFIITSENRVFPHIWEVIEVIPQQKIVYSWNYTGYQGKSYVTFELSKINNQTLLTVTTKVIEDFPNDIPEFKRESCLGGWNYFIKSSLVNYLEH